ncbi:MAG: hypothetical protein R3342_06095 [Lutibacter sp.]|uniref:hypothetical protein n=1 Tax=Lutibacter sp. TaxID=1925666 RepID=UPI00299CF880|nr:hypothetical protein [Lutibacter sp.]MDX1829102.1 hypothetical protein [Lutibacter sp.]
MLTKLISFTFFIILTLNYNLLKAQNKQEYLGVIKLNDTSLISYNLNIIENNGKISGFSITDIGGNNETKSNISGNYNTKTNHLIFKEVGIIYTKSKVSDYDFCYINFDGKVTNINSRNNISGKFKGEFNDGSTCIDGEIALKSIQKIEKKAKKVDNIIQKYKKIDKKVKSKISVLKTLDSLKMNVLKASENLSMFTTSDSLKFKIYDAGKVDGDKITIFNNDTVLLKNFTVSKKIKELIIPLKSKKTTITIKALNIGTISPNTAKVEIIDGTNTVNTLTSLKKGEKTSITILKK